MAGAQYAAAMEGNYLHHSGFEVCGKDPYSVTERRFFDSPKGIMDTEADISLHLSTSTQYMETQFAPTIEEEISYRVLRPETEECAHRSTGGDSSTSHCAQLHFPKDVRGQQFNVLHTAEINAFAESEAVGTAEVASKRCCDIEDMIGQFGKLSFEMSTWTAISKQAQSTNVGERYQGCKQLRMMLSVTGDIPIQAVVDTGVVPTLVSYLGGDHPAELQFEAAWALTNIASGTFRLL